MTTDGPGVAHCGNQREGKAQEYGQTVGGKTTEQKKDGTIWYRTAFERQQ